MLHLKSILALVAMANPSVAFPTRSYLHDLAKAARASPQLCFYPDEFVIKDFKTWTPKDAQEPANITFRYTDERTNLDTECVYNGTQRNIATEGCLPRYMCGFEYIHFTWNDPSGNLTVFERLCYLEDHRWVTRDHTKVRDVDENVRMVFNDAVGWVTPRLDCYNSTNPAGTACFAKPSVIGSLFTGKEPSPMFDQDDLGTGRALEDDKSGGARHAWFSAVVGLAKSV